MSEDQRKAVKEATKKIKLKKIMELTEKVIFGEFKKEFIKMNWGTLEESCCICVEDFDEKEVVTKTNCQHIFHENCLE